MILKGHSRAFNHSQTVRYLKIPLFCKKKDLYRLKIALLSLVVYTHQVSASYSYHRWTNKKPSRKKFLSFICYDVYQCIVVLSILCILCLEDRESSVTPIEVCQD
jgi:hypothetical protein